MDQRYQADSIIPGTVYRVLREIGRGGMGRVYEVEDTSVGKRYALKVLLGTHAASPDIVERMKLESRVLVRVAHPNIVDVFTAGVAGDGSFYYVMELLAGGSLRWLLKKRKRLDLDMAIPIGIDISEALTQAHHLDVVHRDVKPDNIFIATRRDMSTQAKLVDFGIAEMFDHLKSHSEDLGKVLGTPRYASPEQQRGAKASPQMDIWALGYVLFEMIVGHGPFPGRNTVELVAAVQSQEPAKRLSKFAPDIPPRLENLVARMLEKDVAVRASAMSLVASELREIQKEVQAAAQASEADDARTEETLLGLVNRTSPGEPSVEDPRKDPAASAPSAPPSKATDPAAPGAATPAFFANPPRGPRPGSTDVTVPLDAETLMREVRRATRDEPPITESGSDSLPEAAASAPDADIALGPSETNEGASHTISSPASRAGRIRSYGIAGGLGVATVTIIGLGLAILRPVHSPVATAGAAPAAAIGSATPTAPVEVEPAHLPPATSIEPPTVAPPASASLAASQHDQESSAKVVVRPPPQHRPPAGASGDLRAEFKTSFDDGIDKLLSR